MKIILVNSLSNGGGERIAYNIANELSLNEKIILVSLSDDLFYVNQEENVRDNFNIIVLHRFPIFSILFYIFQLRKLIIENNVKLVQSHLYFSNYINILTKVLFGLKNVKFQIVNHGDPLRYKYTNIKGFINRVLIHFLYPKSDSIVAISDGMKFNLMKILKNNNKIIKVNNPYKINNIVSSSCHKIDLKLDLPSKYYVTMGRLIPLKKIHLILDAVHKIKFNLVIIGDGPDLELLKNIVREYKIESYVYFVGNQKNPFPILKKAVAFIGASESEGFPNAIIESLACSTPVIYSDCVSGPREILDYDIISYSEMNIEVTPCGILYPVGDINALCHAIYFIDSNSNVYNFLKSNCYSRSKMFDSSIIIPEYFDL
ncbi:glycosyltransferase [Photobacterium iliopiscarium]|uniref:glycosyltransferase n=1 Tax=Photobacterium iliopiscarium TaxID=56192 RepID=UPI001E419A60|nr:glycosyltransferase [Photobacterium iliopiscarium]MCD9467692.1 hypothetical protein [Photobacterium iliopiscarium]